MSQLLEVSNVEQVFRSGFWMKRVKVLHGISLSIPERSIFGFLGANGAGKTTLIHLLVGLKRPTAGQITLGGRDASHQTWQPAQRARIGYLPERPYFHEHLTGEGLLHYMGALSGMPRPRVASRIPSVLSAVGMTAARKTELRKYSKGMLQRIGIAQAILHDPEFLVLDEPMSGLDPLGRKEMRELILSLASEGRTIFFSSHVIPDVEAICDQVALIQKGKLIGCGSIGSFLAKGPLQTEIGVSGVDAEALEASGRFLSVRRIPDGVRAIVSGQEAVTAALKELLAKNAQILWVNPIRPSLETFFMEPSPSSAGKDPAS